jgi:hypothetical protein
MKKKMKHNYGRFCCINRKKQAMILQPFNGQYKEKQFVVYAIAFQKLQERTYPKFEWRRLQL